MIRIQMQACWKRTLLCFLLVYGGMLLQTCRAQDDAEIFVGDKVVVTVAKAQLGTRNQVTSEVGKGTQLTVTELRGEWIGGYSIINDKKTWGWLNRKEVALFREPQQPHPAEAEVFQSLVKLGVEVQLNDQKRIQSVNARDSKITDEVLAALVKSPALDALDVGSTAVTDAGIAHLSKLPALQKLYIDGCKVTDKGLAPLANLKTLEVLSLNNTAVSGEAIKALQSLTEIRSLNLSRCKIDDEALKQLAAFTKLEVLALANTQLRGSGLQHLRPLSRLRVLNLSDTPLQSAGLQHLRDHRELRMLYVRRSKVSQESIDQLRDAIAGLSIYN